ELEDRPSRALRHAGRDPLTERARTSGLNERHPLVRDQRLADGAAAADHQAEHMLGIGAGGDAVEDLLRCDGDEGREAGRLPNYGVAADQGDRPAPTRHRQGEVERRDDAHDPERVPLLDEAVVATLRGDLAPEQLARLADGKVADVDDLLHLATGFG